jgi:hypothetical protein
MKTRIYTGLIALVVLVAAFAAVASAASKTTNGKVSAFAYNTSTKVGKLTVATSSSKLAFRVTSATNCGVSKGQSGNQIPCKTLGASKYHNKKVTVSWTKSGASRVASLVAVHL